MDKDKKKNNLTSEQKIGRYNIVTNVIKLFCIIILGFIQMLFVKYIICVNYAKYILATIDIICIVHLLKNSIIKEYKKVWIILILFLPVSGAILYFIAGNNTLNKNKKRVLSNIGKKNKEILDKSNFVNIKKLSFIENNSIYKVYNNKGIEYLNDGDIFFKDLIHEIKKAKKSILIEMYIVSKGKLFEDILNVLEERVKQGVSVEIIYDSFGSLFKIPKELKRKINNLGIKLFEYNKICLDLSEYINHRDHKKIIIIDGNIAYTGGINISDEYINKKEMHGYWKDCGIKLYGDIAISYLVMYLKTREELAKEEVDYTKYMLNNSSFKEKEGFVFSFSDGPEIKENIGENVIVNIINDSKKYLYIATPYLIPSPKIINCIKEASRRNVNVIILTPNIVDKKIVEHANRSYYSTLLDSGVKIYEYTPGFIHSKIIVADNYSIVGTINLDYKSLYFNYECANLSYNTGIEKIIKNRFEGMLNNSTIINKDEFNKRSIIQKIKEKIVHFLAPLL